MTKLAEPDEGAVRWAALLVNFVRRDHEPFLIEYGSHIACVDGSGSLVVGRVGEGLRFEKARDMRGRMPRRQ